jgi:hypothetical protein
MEQCPSWETNSRSAIKKQILNLLLNPNDHYRIHKNPSLVHILCLRNSARTLTLYFFEEHLIVCSHLRPFSSRFPATMLQAFLISPMRAKFSDQLIPLYLIIQIISGKIFIMLSLLFYSFLCLKSKYSQHPVLKHEN